MAVCGNTRCSINSYCLAGEEGATLSYTSYLSSMKYSHQTRLSFLALVLSFSNLVPLCMGSPEEPPGPVGSLYPHFATPPTPL